jgi:predicted O-methyltransferase YrrM
MSLLIDKLLKYSDRFFQFLLFSRGVTCDIFTHLTWAEKYKLFLLAKRCPGTVFLEIGAYLGASAYVIAAAIEAKEDAQLFCVDTWRNDAMSEGNRNTHDLFLSNTKRYRNLITPLCGSSSDISQSFQKPIDFLFIDGDHSYEGVRSDVEAWFPKLGKGALVLFHDIGWAPGVQRIVAEAVKARAISDGRLANLYWVWL